MTVLHSLARKSGTCLIALSLAIFAAGCGEDSSTGPEPVPAGNNLVFRNPDGSLISFTPQTGLYIWFADWASDVPVPCLRIGLASPSGGWYMNAAIEDVEEGVPVTFPSDVQYGNVLFFVYNIPNELSSDEEESRGSITFEKFPEEVGDEVAFTIDATIESEFFDAPSVTVTGTFRAVVGDPPPGQ